jgi:hypothetical protein
VEPGNGLPATGERTSRSIERSLSPAAIGHGPHRLSPRQWRELEADYQPQELGDGLGDFLLTGGVSLALVRGEGEPKSSPLLREASPRTRGGVGRKRKTGVESPDPAAAKIGCSSAPRPSLTATAYGQNG